MNLVQCSVILTVYNLVKAETIVGLKGKENL